MKQDMAAIVNWGWDLYRTLVVEQRLGERLNAISSVERLTQTISDPPTKAEVENVQTAVNAIIAAAEAATSS
jgi:hypothetical protein